MRTYLRAMLGVEDNDKLYTSARLNLFLEQAHAGLVADVRKVAPTYYAAVVTLTESGAGHTYNLVSQAGTFAEVLEVRVANASGQELSQVRLEDLNAAAGNRYAISGQDAAVVITTSADVPANSALYLRYSYWPSALTSDIDPPGIPEKFHEIVPLEALFTFELGGEAALPTTLKERWSARKLAFMVHVAERVRQPTKSDAQDLATRAGVRSLVRTLLGVRDDDPNFTDSRINMLLASAFYSLVQDMQDVNPSYFTRSDTLISEQESGDGAHQYVLPADFSRVHELRFGDEDGSQLLFVRHDEFRDVTSSAYTVEDDYDLGLVVRTSPATDAATDLWLKYVYLPTPPLNDYEDGEVAWFYGIPADHHDTLALEAVVLLPEAAQRVAPSVLDRQQDRRGQLLSRVSRPTMQASRARMVEPYEEIL